MEDDSAAVLKKIMDEGIFDDLRKTVIAHLKKNEALQRFTEDRVLNSKTLQGESARTMDKSALFGKLRKELENSVLDQALQATWEILADKEIGMPELIETKVHETLCELHEERAAARMVPKYEG
ncbi:hypothetical protein COCSUDRAFT_68143 [Coccomyxa subellipsoidea C-169]|uniref:Uncharacterized protein n=1 Tax=Coccomyxa subellipsoidea (strain C-169) TaxID=574566 RepID=I0YJU0_COCSC|nr:hypothetical protein COCSUDRAFT_68143 [Coccomyxa subellipsoidea C-169]EIE18659.1 hypothetical protein COCSUDRAFT_68143 [Coccomyxa subellipsoidea C-169]|eukprot:XP_005643203.1 hypothetical protein COCSUDRAFT_68143 [Coccomyxa subellipsoidea C-169]